MPGTEDPERDVPVPVRDRVPELVDGPRSQHQPRRPAAQVTGGVPRIPGVTGLDRAAGERGRYRVVFDARPALGERERVPDPSGGRRAALAAGLVAGLPDPLTHGGGDPAGEILQHPGVIAHHDERADAVLQRQPHEIVGGLAGSDVQQARDLPRVAVKRSGCP
ncbi:MAG: hypothetical protein ACRDN0_14095 [Trebonia sp.]